jgi:hypothetical protein
MNKLGYNTNRFYFRHEFTYSCEDNGILGDGAMLSPPSLQ